MTILSCCGYASFLQTIFVMIASCDMVVTTCLSLLYQYGYIFLKLLFPQTSPKPYLERSYHNYQSNSLMRCSGHYMSEFTLSKWQFYFLHKASLPQTYLVNLTTTICNGLIWHGGHYMGEFALSKWQILYLKLLSPKPIFTKHDSPMWHVATTCVIVLRWQCLVASFLQTYGCKTYL